MKITKDADKTAKELILDIVGTLIGIGLLLGCFAIFVGILAVGVRWALGG